MDNHEAHICLEVVRMAEANGVIFLTLSPHPAINYSLWTPPYMDHPRDRGYFPIVDKESPFMRLLGSLDRLIDQHPFK
ncbi:hypothetical protein HHI36_014331 [Cryptolaemus montrouzieri]|uniref:Uncharacterized protein n=1 Tax=Cryptolaemus montrouzieri TaxID=559131 RepID=A0ABD2N377_9CUCU